MLPSNSFAANVALGRTQCEIPPPSKSLFRRSVCLRVVPREPDTQIRGPAPPPHRLERQAGPFLFVFSVIATARTLPLIVLGFLIVLTRPLHCPQLRSDDVGPLPVLILPGLLGFLMKPKNRSSGCPSTCRNRRPKTGRRCRSSPRSVSGRFCCPPSSSQVLLCSASSPDLYPTPLPAPFLSLPRLFPFTAPLPLLPWTSLNLVSRGNAKQNKFCRVSCRSKISYPWDACFILLTPCVAISAIFMLLLFFLFCFGLVVCLYFLEKIYAFQRPDEVGSLPITRPLRRPPRPADPPAEFRCSVGSGIESSVAARFVDLASLVVSPVCSKP